MDFKALLLGALIGCALEYLVKFIVTKFSERKEVKDNDNINVSGDWYAAWQTSVNGRQVLNTEQLVIKQRGKTVTIENCERAPENPDGGYLWHSKLQFYHGRNLMGWYFPKKEENNTSKGIMFMTYFSPMRLFIGKWSGCGYDGELENGFLVFAKSRESAKNKLDELVNQYPGPVSLISYSFFNERGQENNNKCQ